MAMSTGRVVALIQAMGGADPAVIKAAVQDWLDAHPEATTTVQDGSITEQKLATSIAQKLGLISSLSDEIVDLNSALSEIEDIVTPVNQMTLTYDKITWDNGYLNNTGDLVPHSYYKASEFIPVIEGDTISYDGLMSPGSSYCILAAYNSSKSYQDAKSVRGNAIAESGTYTVPSDISFIKVGTYNSGTPKFNSLILNVKGNEVDKIEDEITEMDSRVTALENENPSYEYTTNFDDYDITTGKAPSVSGEKTDSNLESTDYISTDGITSIAVSNVTMASYGQGNYVCVVAAYDGSKNLLENKSLIASGTYGEIVTVAGTVVITDDIKFIKLSRRISAASTSVFVITNERPFSEDYDATKEIVVSMDSDLNHWKNKKWIAFGTSITDTNNTLAPDGTATGKYVPFLEQLSGMTCTNHGSAGAHISGGILANVVGWASQLQNADVITIEGSVNDWFSGIPLGEVGDTTPYLCIDSSDPDYVYEQPLTAQILSDLGGSKNGSFAGALYQIFKQAQLQISEYATIVYITDTTGKQYGSTDERRSVGITEKVTGDIVYQNDYIKMAIAVAEYMSIPVIDAGRLSRISEDNPDMIIDQIHHTEEGGYRYAKSIWSILKNIPLIEPLVTP